MAIRNWNDSEIDSAFYLQMQDLTTVLTGDSSFKFIYSYGSFIDLFNRELAGSSLWDVPYKKNQEAGYKTDLYLRILGTMRYSDIHVLKEYFSDLSNIVISKFASQLVTFLEDMRLESMIEKERPGTKEDFHIRNTYLKHYFLTQLKTNIVRGFALDELFCLIYLRLYADEPDPDFDMANHKQIDQLKRIETRILMYSQREVLVILQALLQTL